MDSRAVLHPVGPLPPRVYWLRRLVPLVVLLVLVLAIAISCSGGGGGGGRGQTVATRGGTPTVSPSTTSTPQPCHLSGLAVSASTDAARYPAGALPHLSVSVRNIGSSPCVFQDTPSRRIWTIVSGADQVWTTAGCPTAKVVTIRTLAAGATLRHSMVWDRHRSAKNCATSTTSPGPGTYQLLVTVDGAHSAPAVFHLTG